MGDQSCMLIDCKRFIQFVIVSIDAALASSQYCIYFRSNYFQFLHRWPFTWEKDSRDFFKSARMRCLSLFWLFTWSEVCIISSNLDRLTTSCRRCPSSIQLMQHILLSLHFFSIQRSCIACLQCYSHLCSFLHVPSPIMIVIQFYSSWVKRYKRSILSLETVFW